MDEYLSRLDRFIRPQNHGYIWLGLVALIVAVIVFGGSGDTDPSVQTIGGLILVWCFAGVVVRAIERFRSHR